MSLSFRDLPMRFSRDRQGVLDTRALELAAGTTAVLTQHLDECRDRYLATERGQKELKDAIESNRASREESSRRLYALLWKVAGAVILLLLVIIGYLIDKGGLPLHHP